jgi:hypothetical protein
MRNAIKKAQVLFEPEVADEFRRRKKLIEDTSRKSK